MTNTSYIGRVQVTSDWAYIYWLWSILTYRSKTTRVTNKMKLVIFRVHENSPV